MAAFVSRYARAFADVVADAHLDTLAIETQLDDFLGTWNGSAELAEFFSNPSVATVQKVEFLDKMNATLGMRKEVRNLMAVLIRNGRIAHVREVVVAYRAEMQARMGIRQAEVTTARTLDAGEKTELLAGIGKLAGSKVEASFKLDASILGGAVVRIGSTVYDGSVRGRLDRLKDVLVSS